MPARGAATHSGLSFLLPRRTMRNLFSGNLGQRTSHREQAANPANSRTHIGSVSTWSAFSYASGRRKRKAKSEQLSFALFRRRRQAARVLQLTLTKLILQKTTTKSVEECLDGRCAGA